MKTNRQHRDSALRKAMDEQAQEAKRMRLSDDFTDNVMRKIADIQDVAPATSTRIQRIGMLRKIAAVFVAAVLVGGMAYATYYAVWGSSNDGAVAVSPQEETVAVQQTDSLVRFDGLPLDSILRVVSAHYNRAVCFRDASTDSLRLTTVWDKSLSLASFIETLNEFDGLRLTDREDTIFVESVKAED